MSVLRKSCELSFKIKQAERYETISLLIAIALNSLPLLQGGINSVG